MSCESERSVGNNPEAQALSHVHTHTQTVSTHHCALSPLLPLHTHNLTPVLLLLFLFSPPPITIFPQTLDFRAFILTVASHQTQLFTKVSKRTRQLARRQQQRPDTHKASAIASALIFFPRNQQQGKGFDQSHRHTRSGPFHPVASAQGYPTPSTLSPPFQA